MRACVQRRLIANLNTSRVAPRRERKIRIFQPDAISRSTTRAPRIQLPQIAAAAREFIGNIRAAIDLASDPLADEVAAVATPYARAARRGHRLDGLRVMEVSERIRTRCTETDTRCLTRRHCRASIIKQA